jgi:diaminopimelate decarboxylase
MAAKTIIMEHFCPSIFEHSASQVEAVITPNIFTKLRENSNIFAAKKSSLMGVKFSRLRMFLQATARDVGVHCNVGCENTDPQSAVDVDPHQEELVGGRQQQQH